MSVLTLPQDPRFISLEGGEGVGKTTVINALHAALLAEGRPVVRTREPGGTPLAEQIRDLLLCAGQEPPTAQAELLLMFAARAQHVHQVIAPALRRGDWVISDRFTDSSYAYQGGGRGLDPELIATLERSVVGLQPGLTLLLDLDVVQGRIRARDRDGQPDRIEAEHDRFFERARAVFRARAAADPARIVLINADQSVHQVAADAVAALNRHRQRCQADMT